MPMDMALYMRNRYAERIAAAKEKLGGRCVRCGTVEGLQFDHIDPATKIADIASLTPLGGERFWAEVAKCQLLCGACHRSKTATDLGYGTGHGRLRSYQGGCRCDECHNAILTWSREWRLKRRAGNSAVRVSDS